MVHGVIVPVTDTTAQWAIELGGHDIHACFNQSPGQQALLPPLFATVPLSQGIGFTVQVECLLGIGTRQKRKGLGFKVINRLHQPGLVDIPPQPVEGRPEVGPTLQPDKGVLFDSNVRNSKSRLAGITSDTKCFVRRPQIRRAGNLKRVVSINRIQRDVVWQCSGRSRP